MSLSPAKAQLRRWLRQERDRFQLRPGMLYRGPADFVLAHGEWFDIEHCHTMFPQQCYQNAIIMAESQDCTYVEGFAVSPSMALMQELGMRYEGPQVVQHAWVVAPSGTPVEVTWPVPGQAYRGVRFHHGRADDATWNGDACVLDDSNRDYPLFRQAWTGEDWSRVWEPTEGLELIREVLAARV